MSQHWVDVMNNSRVGRYMDGVEKSIITPRLPTTPLNVLDIGGGTGRWSRWLTAQGHRQVLMDIDRSALKTIQKHSPQLNILQANAQHIPAPSAAFDAVFAVQLFGLLDDHPRFLRELHRVLKPDGLLFISWSNRASIKGLLYQTYSALKGTPPAARFQFYSTTHQENLALLQESGFALLDALGYSWTLLPRSHNTPLVDLFSALERGLRLNRLVAYSPNVMMAARKCES